ncbi:hypothetical protein [Paratractidigestivibacter sp.]|uniref:hypothetical protein n=1 Tax=Paratractidigestivibacter sp. TaxID=2847316 RepID=UPI002ACB08AE|nr:hypothetical protein [Paratractidigestivibacter sp.]
MLNFYYIYGAVWGIVLFLYLLGWSSLNGSLSPVLLVFFSVTIFLSAALGKRRESCFVYSGNKLPKLPTWAVLLFLVCGAIGFMQLGYIPALQFIDSTYDYQQLLDREPSIFMTVAVVGSVFGCGYQFSRFIENREAADMAKLIPLALYLVMFSSRGPLYICGVTCFIIVCSKRKRTLRFADYLITAILIIFALWLFGVLGNIRVGCNWNDSSYIYLLGGFTGLWPEYIPHEFCWAYSYLTSPLANLNYSLSFTVQIDSLNFLYDFLPMMLAKRLPLYVTPAAPLQVTYFNVSSVWSNYFLHLDLPGLFIGYLLQIALLETWLLAARGTCAENLMKAYCSECVIFSFFANSFVYPTMAYPAIMLGCACIFWKCSSRKRALSYLSARDVKPLLED